MPTPDLAPTTTPTDLARFLRCVALPVSNGRSSRNRLRKAMTSFWSFADRGVSDNLVRASAGHVGVNRFAVTHAASQWCTVGPAGDVCSISDDETALLFAIPVIARASGGPLPSVSACAEALYRNLIGDGELTVSENRFSLLPQLMSFESLPRSPDVARSYFHALLRSAGDSRWRRCLPATHSIAGLRTDALAHEHLDTGLSLSFLVGVSVVQTTRPVFRSVSPGAPLRWPEALARALSRAPGMDDVVVVPPCPYFLQTLSLGLSFCCGHALLRAASLACSSVDESQRVYVRIGSCEPHDPSTLRLVFLSSSGKVLASSPWSVGQDASYAPLLAALSQASNSYGVNIDQATLLRECFAD